MKYSEELNRINTVIKADRTGITEDMSGAISHDVGEVLKKYFKIIGKVKTQITVEEDINIVLTVTADSFKNIIATHKAV